MVVIINFSDGYASLSLWLALVLTQWGQFEAEYGDSIDMTRGLGANLMLLREHITGTRQPVSEGGLELHHQLWHVWNNIHIFTLII